MTTESADSLAGLLAAASAADPGDRVERYRDRIASFGPPAIEALRPWLSDNRLNAFAVTVIEKSGTFAAKRAACSALRAAKDDPACIAVATLVQGALGRLGCGPVVPPGPGNPPKPPRGLLPEGTLVAPPYDVVAHVIEDHVPAELSRSFWGELYLFECGRFFSGRWVHDHGDPRSAREHEVCGPCHGATMQRRPPAGAAITMPEDIDTPTWVASDAVWHRVSGGLLVGPSVGPFYAFHCYRWATKAEAERRGMQRSLPPTDRPLCGTCEWYRELHERDGVVDGGAAEADGSV